MRSDACLTSGRSSQPAAATTAWRASPAPPAACYRRARLSALAGEGSFGEPSGGAFGCGVGFDAASNLASAARSGSRRGARGNLSVSMARRIAAVIAASSSSVRSIVGMGGSAFPAHRGDARISCESVSSEFDPSARNFSDCVSAAVADADSPGLISLQVPWNGHRESY
jgi:hypothetical protein